MASVACPGMTVLCPANLNGHVNRHTSLRARGLLCYNHLVSLNIKLIKLTTLLYYFTLSKFVCDYKLGFPKLPNRQSSDPLDVCFKFIDRYSFGLCYKLFSTHQINAGALKISSLKLTSWGMLILSR